MTSTTIPSFFDIEFEYLSSLSQDLRDIFENAAADWERVIVGDLPDVDYSAQAFPANACFGLNPDPVDTVVDDLLVFVVEQPWDGVGGTLALSGVCDRSRRGAPRLPSLAVIIIDSADTANLDGTDLGRNLIRHELGHSLGFGNLWWLPDFDLVRDLSSTRDPNDPGADPGVAPGGIVDTHFIGMQARDAFDGVGGQSYVGETVPVENDKQTYGGFSLDIHWRESAMASELMTSDISPAGMDPLSAVTVGSLADLGYQVNVNAADTYSLPTGGSMRGRKRAESVPLGDCVLRAPLRPGR